MSESGGGIERRYDKGERRFKHVGKTSEPEFEYPSDNPKRVIGKSPNNVGEADRDRLLSAAIQTGNGDRELATPKKVYAVYRGAIYEAQTSDGGTTYHAYPYQGHLPPSLIGQLRAMADEE